MKDELKDPFKELYEKYDNNNYLLSKVVMPPKDYEDERIERIKSPFASFSRYVGGGPAIGKITTFAGLFSTGKTSLALAFAGANPEMTVGFVDCEYNWTQSSYTWVRDMYNINKNRIIVLQPTYIEEAADMVYDLCQKVDIVIYDGFDMIGANSEYTGTMDQNSIAREPRVYKKFFRKFMSAIYRTNTTVLITNHLYANIGNAFQPLVEPGGHALKSYASQRFWLTCQKIKDKKQDNLAIGQKINIRVKKDKLTGNHEFRFSLPYYKQEGFSSIEDVINLAIIDGIIKQSGSWYRYDNETLGQGLPVVKAFLNDNPELYKEIFNTVSWPEITPKSKNKNIDI